MFTVFTCILLASLLIVSHAREASGLQADARGRRGAPRVQNTPCSKNEYDTGDGQQQAPTKTPGASQFAFTSSKFNGKLVDYATDDYTGVMGLSMNNDQKGLSVDCWYKGREVLCAQRGSLCLRATLRLDPASYSCFESQPL